MEKYYLMVFLGEDRRAKNYALFKNAESFQRARSCRHGKTKSAYEQCDTWCTSLSEVAMCLRNGHIEKQTFIISD